jgi:ankyrin repeat protein
VQLLLDHGANVNYSELDGWTPLIHAAGSGHCDVVRTLLDHGADVNQPDQAKQTPLYYAAYEGHHAVVQVLLEPERHVDFNVVAADGRTAIRVAADNNFGDIVGLLREAGAILDPLDAQLAHVLKQTEY